MLTHYPDLNLGFVAIPKCATTSINALRRPFCKVTAAEFVTIPKRVALWREPASRMVAAWKEPRRDHPIDGEPFNDFVLRVCKDHGGDVHAISQTEHCQLADLTEIIFWDFARLCEVLCVSGIPHLQSSSAALPEWSDEARLAFDKAYASDIEVWQGGPLNG